MCGDVNAFMNGYTSNRMEPEGPNRYLKTDTDIRKYMQQDRKIVSSIVVDSVITILQNNYHFTDEQLMTFHDELQKEISKR